MIGSLTVIVAAGPPPPADLDGRTIPDGNPFPNYAVALLIVSGLTVFKLPETKGRDLHAS